MLRKENPSALYVRIQIVVATVENNMEFPQKIKNGTALSPSDSTFENIPWEYLNTNSKAYMHLYVHCSVIYNSQDMEATQVPISRWVDKEVIAHMYNVIFSHKKE